MGLFRGFKAKFTRNSKPKNKSGEVVVPLNFRIKTEFDSPKPPDPVPNLRPALRTTNSRYNRPIPRSQYFEETSRAIQLKLQSTSLTNLPAATAEEKKSNNKKSSIEHEYEEPISPPPVPHSPPPVLNSPPPNANPRINNVNPLANSRINNVKEKRLTPPTEDEYYKSNSMYTPTKSFNIPYADDDYEEVTPTEEPSTLILMTQHSDSSLASYVKTPNTPENYFKNQSKVFDFPSETEEDFKVNVVNHDLSNYVSEDELTQDEEEYQTREESASQYPRASYSSQATNLFFGESEPVIQRPRKLRLRDVTETDEDDC
ncbi:uncharacterized protein LOC114325901 [Diabrotica virgifera virgifera]|uniref:Uncharacterized protein n=1 Tax=Diabrotica virgifera virgifera TaxID=50390 RepID=A0ABM5ICJ5_DIAVI|nr:uncharacterized protein LOC114325901 [Diabrotica virgifera virgifera]